MFRMKLFILLLLFLVALNTKHSKHKKYRKHRKTPKGPKSMLNIPSYGGFPFPNPYSSTDPKNPSLLNVMVVDSYGNIVKSSIDKSQMNRP